MDGASAAVAEPVVRVTCGKPVFRLAGLSHWRKVWRGGWVDFTRRESTQAESSPASAEWSQ